MQIKHQNLQISPSDTAILDEFSDKESTIFYAKFVLFYYKLSANLMHILIGQRREKSRGIWLWRILKGMGNLEGGREIISAPQMR